MKKTVFTIVIVTIMIMLCGCARTKIDKNSDVKLTFIYEDQNLNATLDDSDAKKIISILDGNRYTGATACYFDENISFNIDDEIFAVACDGCRVIKDISNQKYFWVSDSDMKYIRSVFEKHGGHFTWLE